MVLIDAVKGPYFMKQDYPRLIIIILSLTYSRFCGRYITLTQINTGKVRVHFETNQLQHET